MNKLLYQAETGEKVKWSGQTYEVLEVSKLPGPACIYDVHLQPLLYHEQVFRVILRVHPVLVA